MFHEKKKVLVTAAAMIFCLSSGIMASAASDSRNTGSSLMTSSAATSTYSAAAITTANSSGSSSSFVPAAPNNSSVSSQAYSNSSTASSSTNANTIPDYYNDSAYDTAGNASLIKEQKIIYDSAEMQFIAVTTRDGHVFYILIDYTAVKAAENGEEGADGRETVYFLNKVDDYDLYALLNTDENGDNDNAYHDNSHRQMFEEDSSAATSQTRTDSVPKKSSKLKNSGKNLAFAGIFVIITVVIAYFAKFKRKKNQVEDDDEEDFEFDDEEVNVDDE